MAIYSAIPNDSVPFEHEQDIVRTEESFTFNSTIICSNFSYCCSSTQRKSLIIRRKILSTTTVSLLITFAN